jgi:hypothetical protein
MGALQFGTLNLNGSSLHHPLWPIHKYSALAESNCASWSRGAPIEIISIGSLELDIDIAAI